MASAAGAATPPPASPSPHPTTPTAVTPTSTFGIAGDPSEAAKCRELVSKALDRDDKVKTLREALTKLGIATGNMVHCDHCPDNVAAAGGYVPSERRVVLCQQWAAKMPSEVNNTLAHEMVHAFDDARAYLDWGNLTHQACTEIRAAALSGDCTWGREINRGNLGFVAGGGARCIRRRAELSVAMNPACPSKMAAQRAVDEAWDHCFKDRAPFAQAIANPPKS